MASNKTEQAGGLSWGWAFLIVALVLTLSGVGIIFYFGRKPDKEKEGKKTAPDTQTDVLGNVVQYTNELRDLIKEAASKGIAVFPQPKEYYDESDTEGWPLQRVFGTELQKEHPYVKDAQQYLVQAKGEKLDIDGAFGSATETAVLKHFGTKTISKQTYNQIIAPYLGKAAA